MAYDVSLQPLRVLRCCFTPTSQPPLWRTWRTLHLLSSCSGDAALGGCWAAGLQSNCMDEMQFSLEIPPGLILPPDVPPDCQKPPSTPPQMTLHWGEDWLKWLTDPHPQSSRSSHSGHQSPNPQHLFTYWRVLRRTISFLVFNAPTMPACIGREQLPRPLPPKVNFRTWHRPRVTFMQQVPIPIQHLSQPAASDVFGALHPCGLAPLAG